jgi:hypothetical protein
VSLGQAGRKREKDHRSKGRPSGSVLDMQSDVASERKKLGKGQKK